MAATRKTNRQLLANGILAENPIFRLALSMCPAVGITTTIMNGVLLGVAVLFVQVGSSCTISAIKRWIHPRIRIPTYTLTIATWVTMIDLLLAAFVPGAYKAMGIFVKLIVAFAIITMRLEMFAAKNAVIPSFFDALGMGIGFLTGMVTLGAVRELLGSGTLLGHDVLGTRPLLFFVLPAAGFFTVGFMMAIFNRIDREYARRKLARSRRERAGHASMGALPAGAGTVATPVMLLLALLALAATGCVRERTFVERASFHDRDAIDLTFAHAVDPGWAGDPARVIVVTEPDPDIRLTVAGVTLAPDRRHARVTFDAPLDTSKPHLVTCRDLVSGGRNAGTAGATARKSAFGQLLGILIGAMLVKNYVFTRYLGLCVFFGTSQKKSTAIGMGITFTLVMVASAMLSWFLYRYVLKPFRLDFLQVIVFIGMVSLSVQAVDTVLRKVNPALFRAFGVYLVLVIANCIILAVPLVIATSEYNAAESLMLALGAGGGFLLALFLMSSVRERLELARIPESFRGLPIAFITAGLFALAFMGFSGMSLF